MRRERAQSASNKSLMYSSWANESSDERPVRQFMIINFMRSRRSRAFFVPRPSVTNAVNRSAKSHSSFGTRPSTGGPCRSRKASLMKRSVSPPSSEILSWSTVARARSSKASASAENDVFVAFLASSSKNQPMASTNVTRLAVCFPEHDSLRAPQSTVKSSSTFRARKRFHNVLSHSKASVAAAICISARCCSSSSNCEKCNARATSELREFVINERLRTRIVRFVMVMNLSLFCCSLTRETTVLRRAARAPTEGGSHAPSVRQTQPLFAERARAAVNKPRRPRHSETRTYDAV